VFGNVSVDLATRNALILTELLGVGDVVVAAGAGKPLVGERLPAPDFVHGSDGLGNLNLAAPTAQPDARSAARFIIDMANQYPGEVVVIAVGPLTNMAAALSEDPGLPDKLRELIVMGGTGMSQVMCHLSPKPIF
jgi:inosine-uridine nucleoside N-ribohydrolase